MLTREYFGRTHKRRLIAVKRGIIHRKKRDYRFSRTYVALDQKVRFFARAHTFYYIAERGFLCGSKRIRKRRNRCVKFVGAVAVTERLVCRRTFYE